jgi:hypothetical protein
MQRISVLGLVLVICGCTTIYVQTGNGHIERVTDIERHLGRTIVTDPKKELTWP